jgi:hypothetical protein
MVSFVRVVYKDKSRAAVAGRDIVVLSAVYVYPVAPQSPVIHALNVVRRWAKTRHAAWL